MLFILEFGVACLVYFWRAELIDEIGRYDEISDDSVGYNLPTFNPYASGMTGNIQKYSNIEERSAEL